MIAIVTQDQKYSELVKKQLREHGLVASFYDLQKIESLNEVCTPSAEVVVVDDKHPNLDRTTWLDLLTSVGKRVPVILVTDDMQAFEQSSAETPDQSVRTLSVVEKNDLTVLLDTIRLFVTVHEGHEVSPKDNIPVYNPQVPVSLLVKNGWLSTLVIDASALRDFRLEFGVDVYHHVQDVFSKVLLSLWGASGSFRKADVLCKRSSHSNIFYVFLDRARSGSGLPIPGALEKIADRLVVRLQNALWKELVSDRRKKILPEGVHGIPEFIVGHATCLVNPCVDLHDQVDSLIESANSAARIQMKRLHHKQKELLQSIIHAQDLLYPNYQAVFRLPGITKEQVDLAHKTRSIKPFADELYGFESLIRVRSDWVGISLGSEEPGFFDARFLTPDVLFGMAQASDIAVELDQACLYQATLHAQKLPGRLFINIFPRNLYYVDRLQHLIKHRSDIIFEVAESEAINNIDLMVKVRTTLEQKSIRIAVDDLGKGYAGLERIIKIRPDLIKFDRSLIENIHEETAKQAFVQGLVNAAKIAGAEVLAEGVEKWEEAVVLQQFGVDLIQGYLMHRPQAVDKICEDLDIKFVAPTLKVAS
jgi:EAL domain-containing protein (putative c-di-GMP-specific phosphodiesterase class I)